MKTFRFILLVIALALTAFLIIEAAKTPFEKETKEMAEHPTPPQGEQQIKK
jgi:hypothetical protein